MVDNQPSPHVLGRTFARLSDVTRGSDMAFGSERHDSALLEHWHFEHCTFVNISFLESTLRNGNFLNCVFVECYFRKSTLDSSKFTGCRFIDCNFNRVSVLSSQFVYSSFRSCQIPYKELQHSLPREPNLREDLTRNLFLESRALGLSSEAREYRLAALRAREDHLSAAFTGRSKWYREHFDCMARVYAGVRLVFSRLNGVLWGYGENARRLLLNIALLALLVFPILFSFASNGVASVDGRELRIWDYIYFSIETAFPTPLNSGVVAVGHTARILTIVESLLGYLFIALVASHVFRWSIRR